MERRRSIGIMIFMTPTPENQRSGQDRRETVDPNNPELQSWIRRFWNRYYKDNPDKNRRLNADRRKANKKGGVFGLIRFLFAKKSD